MLTITNKEITSLTANGQLPTSQQSTGVVRVTPQAKSRNSLSAEQEQPVPTLLELDQAQANQVYDLFDVDQFKMDIQQGKAGEQVGHMHAFLQLIENSPELTLHAWIIHRVTGNVLCEIPVKRVENEKSCVLCEEFSIDNSLSPDDLLLTVEGIWSVNGKLQDVVKTVDCTVTWGKLTYNHYHPVKKEKPDDQPTIIGNLPEDGEKLLKDLRHDESHIVLCFLRHPDQFGDLDYIVNFGRNIQYDHTLFGIPGSGHILAPANMDFVSGEGKCLLYPKSGGVMLAAASSGYSVQIHKEDWMNTANLEVDTKYHTQPGDIRVTGSGSSAHYEMMSAWDGGKEVFNEEGWMKSHYFDYELSLDLVFEEKNKNKHTFQLFVTSRTEHLMRADEYYRILPLRIMFGCLKQGTQINTLTGVYPIEEIKIGDSVLDAKGQPIRVLNVWRGVEPDGYLKLTTANGCLEVTADHPICTPNGMKRARNLANGDLVTTADGSCAVQIENCSDLINVYNLDTEGSVPFMANGFLVGDMGEQNRFTMPNGG